jgi:hypothetical protein
MERVSLLSKQPCTDQALAIFASETLATAIATELLPASGVPVATIFTLIVNSPSTS